VSDRSESDVLTGKLSGEVLSDAPFVVANWAPTELSKKPPEEAFLAAARLVAAFLGSSIFLVANWAPTELSKKPADGALMAACLGAAFLGASILVANWAPTELSKNPFEEPATQHFVVRV